MFRLIFWFGWIVALIFGGQQLWVGVANLKPTQISLASYLDEKPSAKWLELSECYINYTETVNVVGLGKRVKGRYVPLRRDSDDEGTVDVVLKIKDRGTIAMLKDIEQAGEEQVFKAVLEHAAELTGTRTVKGLVQFGADSDGDTRKLLRGAGWQLASEFIILDQGGTPSLAGALIMVGLGLLWGFFAIRSILGKGKSRQAVPATVMPTGAGPTAPAPPQAPPPPPPA